MSKPTRMTAAPPLRSGRLPFQGSRREPRNSAHSLSPATRCEPVGPNKHRTGRLLQCRQQRLRRGECANISKASVSSFNPPSCQYSGLTHSVMRAIVFLSGRSQRLHGLFIPLHGPPFDRITREIAVSMFPYFTYWFRRRHGNNSWQLNVATLFHGFVGRIILKGVATRKAFEGLHQFSNLTNPAERLQMCRGLVRKMDILHPLLNLR